MSQQGTAGEWQGYGTDLPAEENIALIGLRHTTGWAVLSCALNQFSNVKKSCPC